MITSDGFLKITGRIKELIITAGGENISPVLIEDKFKEHCGVCSNIMVVGDYKKFLTALITLKTEPDKVTGIPTKEISPEIRNILKRDAGVSVKSTDEAVKDEKVKKYIQICIDKANDEAVSRAAGIRKWVLKAQDFSPDGGELTATLKLRRKATEKKYSALIEEMYIETDARL